MNENDNANLLAAKQKFSKADKILRIGVAIFLIFVLSLVTFTSVQVYIVQNIIAENQIKNKAASDDRFQRYNAEAARQQQITQQYIACIAKVFLVPPDNRTPVGFETCSKAAQSQNLSGETSTRPAP